MPGSEFEPRSPLQKETPPTRVVFLFGAFSICAANRPPAATFIEKRRETRKGFPRKHPPSSRRTKDSAFVRRKELAADTHARSAFQSEVRQSFYVDLISSIPRAWIETPPSKWMGAFASTAKGANVVKQEELNGSPWNLLPLRPACDGLRGG